MKTPRIYYCVGVKVIVTVGLTPVGLMLASTVGDTCIEVGAIVAPWLAGVGLTNPLCGAVPLFDSKTTTKIISITATSRYKKLLDINTDYIMRVKKLLKECKNRGRKSLLKFGIKKVDNVALFLFN